MRTDGHDEAKRMPFANYTSPPKKCWPWLMISFPYSRDNTNVPYVFVRSARYYCPILPKFFVSQIFVRVPITKLKKKNIPWEPCWYMWSGGRTWHSLQSLFATICVGLFLNRPTQIRTDSDPNTRHMLYLPHKIARLKTTSKLIWR